MTNKIQTMDSDPLDSTENTEKTPLTVEVETVRDIRGHRWQVGQSGNPGGRPRIKGDERLAIEFAKKKSLRAVKTLYRLMSSSSERVRLLAAQALLDRGLGKPAMAITGPGGSPLFPQAGAVTTVTTAAEAEAVYRSLMGDPHFDMSGITFATPAALPAIEVPVAAIAKVEPAQRTAGAPLPESISTVGAMWAKLGSME
jgi:hypothetical protein